MKNLIDKLHQEQILSAEEFRTLLTERSEETDLYARQTRCGSRSMETRSMYVA